MSGSGISWAVCKSAPRSRQITTPAPHRSVFTGRVPFLPPNQQRQSTVQYTSTETAANISGRSTMSRMTVELRAPGPARNESHVQCCIVTAVTALCSFLIRFSALSFFECSAVEWRRSMSAENVALTRKVVCTIARRCRWRSSSLTARKADAICAEASTC